MALHPAAAVGAVAALGQLLHPIALNTRTGVRNQQAHARLLWGTGTGTAMRDPSQPFPNLSKPPWFHLAPRRPTPSFLGAKEERQMLSKLYLLHHRLTGLYSRMLPDCFSSCLKHTVEQQHYILSGTALCGLPDQVTLEIKIQVFSSLPCLILGRQ